MKNHMKLLKWFAVGMLATNVCACVDLEPEPLSFFAPENTFMDKEGLEAALVTSRKQIKHEWFGDAFDAGACRTPIVYEYAFSDLSVIGSPPVKEIHNLTTQLTPTTNASLHLRYWELAWNGIKYANTVVSRAPLANIEEDEKNVYLAEAYFHRAYWYYLLVNQWGNVPLVLEELTQPKLDFYTASREKILEQMKTDLEFAVQWLPVTVEPGAVSRAAGEHLLTKIYLSIGDFEAAAQLQQSGDPSARPDTACRGGQSPGDDLQKSALAGTIAPHDTDTFSFTDGKVDMMQCFETAVEPAAAPAQHLQQTMDRTVVDLENLAHILQDDGCILRGGICRRIRLRRLRIKGHRQILFLF